MTNITLRPLQSTDITALFAFHKDKQDAWCAGFAPDPEDEVAFRQRMEALLARDPNELAVQVIEEGGNVTGYICYFMRGQELEVTYWMGAAFRGRGVATFAFQQLLPVIRTRFPGEPLFARGVDGNEPSARVLAKCGFKAIRRESFFSEVRGEEVWETVFSTE